MKIEEHNLQPQQQLAVSCYMKSMNKTQAAKDAGYSTTSVFDHPEVSAAIAEQLAIRAERLRVGADWVLAEAVRVYQRCMQTEKILDRDGNHTGEFKFDANNAIKALALVGKHVDVKAFDQVVEASQEDSELVERLRRGRQRTFKGADK
jgi:phage terminase small subunit